MGRTDVDLGVETPRIARTVHEYYSVYEVHPAFAAQFRTLVENDIRWRRQILYFLQVISVCGTDRLIVSAIYMLDVAKYFVCIGRVLVGQLLTDDDLADC